MRICLTKCPPAIRFVAWSAVLSSIPWAINGDPPSPRAPVYDATGDWVLHVSGLRLLSGECPLTDDEGYDEQAHIEQHGRCFVITVRDGTSERGAIDGATYTHQGSQYGTDITGVSFSVLSKSTFKLTSPVAATGNTLLTIRFEDGTQCVLDLRFSGERRNKGWSP